jgi:hypothetical protein
MVKRAWPTWVRLVCAAGVLVATACGTASPAAISTAAPTAAVSGAPTLAPVPTLPPAAPTPTAVPQSTVAPTPTVPATPRTVWVGNTDGQGVFVRRTPTLPDKLQAYPDGTPLTIIGADVDGDGQRWHHIRALDGVEGYVPVMYTVTVEPTIPPTAAPTVATAPPKLQTPTLVPMPTAAPPNTCGAPPNPWGYNFCGRGGTVRVAPSDFCSYFNCIPSFWKLTNGYVAQCRDGLFSHSGGVRGACSSHGGVGRALNGP